MIRINAYEASLSGGSQWQHFRIGCRRLPIHA
jgi:hypothetical protein